MQDLRSPGAPVFIAALNEELLFSHKKEKSSHGVGVPARFSRTRALLRRAIPAPRLSSSGRRARHGQERGG